MNKYQNKDSTCSLSSFFSKTVKPPNKLEQRNKEPKPPCMYTKIANFTLEFPDKRGLKAKKKFVLATYKKR